MFPSLRQPFRAKCSHLWYYVDELLIEGADYYEREVDYGVKSLTAKIEPLLLVVVSLIVGLLALGIFSPMWDMYGAMQGKQ